MADYEEQAGAHFEHVNLRGAAFTDVYLNCASFRDVDLSGAQVRMARFNGSRMRGVELVDVTIYGELDNVVVNGVDIAPLVDAELNRRMPERAKMRPDDPEGFREAWVILERLWDDTLGRARSIPQETLHRSVDDEWSFIQTLRHLNFASAAWVGRMILGFWATPRRGTPWTSHGTRRRAGRVTNSSPASHKCERTGVRFGTCCVLETGPSQRVRVPPG